MPVGSSTFLLIKVVKDGLLAIKNINFCSSNTFEISDELIMHFGCLSFRIVLTSFGP
jgi:hypothetical protein